MPLQDRLLINGRFWSPERPATLGREVLIRAGKIAAITEGTELSESTDPSLPRWDLEGRFVTPGFWDAHLHLYHWCLSRGYADLRQVTDLETLARALESVDRSQEWLVGWGWNATGYREPRPLQREDLDRIVGDRPCLIWGSDMHCATVNTEGLRRADLLDWQVEVEGGVIERLEDGSPTGLLKELAVNLVRDLIAEPTDEQLKALLRDGFRELHRLGITAVCDQRIKDLDEGPRLLRVLQQLEEEGALPLRVSLNLAAHHLTSASQLGLRTGWGSERIRLGHVKVFADGTLGSRTAKMLEPFEGLPAQEEGRGLYLTSPRQMREEFEAAARAGFSVSVHAIGDEANRSCLDLFESLDEAGVPRPRVPHRIEHAQLLDDAELSRFRDLGVTASVQPGHLLDDRRAAEEFLGSRSRLAYRFADLLRSGALLAMGSDAPVSEVDPIYGFRAATQRSDEGGSPWHPEQLLTPEQTLAGYTLHAAAACGWSDRCGSLTPGKNADLVVWSEDLRQSGPGRPSVLATLVSGEVVFDATKA